MKQANDFQGPDDTPIEETGVNSNVLMFPSNAWTQVDGWVIQMQLNNLVETYGHDEVYDIVQLLFGKAS